MNELKNDIMFNLLRHRADVEHRELLRAMRRNQQLNKQFEDLQAEGNLYVPYQYYCPRTGELVQGDRLGNVVLKIIGKKGGHRRPAHPDGKRSAP